MFGVVLSSEPVQSIAVSTRDARSRQKDVPAGARCRKLTARARNTVAIKTSKNTQLTSHHRAVSPARATASNRYSCDRKTEQNQKKSIQFRRKVATVLPPVSRQVIIIRNRFAPWE